MPYVLGVIGVSYIIPNHSKVKYTNILELLRWILYATFTIIAAIPLIPFPFECLEEKNINFVNVLLIIAIGFKKGSLLLILILIGVLGCPVIIYYLLMKAK